jgi:MYXO-CTERM domain-containing protein
MDRFEVITHGSRSGEFTTVTGLDDLGGYAGLDFALMYEDDAVVLEAAAVPGDANLDAKVDVFDLAVLANHYNLTGTDWFEADFNRDGVVNVFDLAALANHYGYDGTGGEAIPEPAGLSVLALGALALIRRRRRR